MTAKPTSSRFSFTVRLLVLGCFAVFYAWFAYFVFSYRDVSEAYRKFFIDKSVNHYVKDGTLDYEWGKIVDARRPALYFDKGWRYEHKKHYSVKDKGALLFRFGENYVGDACLIFAATVGVLKGSSDVTDVSLNMTFAGEETHSWAMRDGRLYVRFKDLQIVADQEVALQVTTSGTIVVQAFSIEKGGC